MGHYQHYFRREQVEGVVDEEGRSVKELEGLRLKSDFEKVRDVADLSRAEVAALMEVPEEEYGTLEDGGHHGIEKWGTVICRCAMACGRPLPRLLKREKAMEGYPKEMLPTVGETVAQSLSVLEGEGGDESAASTLRWWVGSCPRLKVTVQELDLFLQGECSEAEEACSVLLLFGTSIDQEPNLFSIWTWG